MDFVNFLIKNYLWIVIVFGILVISLIGFLADRYNKSRKQMKTVKEENKNKEAVNIVDINGDNLVDTNPSLEETPLVTEEMVSESDNFNFPEVDSSDMTYDPTPITSTSFESNNDSFMMPEVENNNGSLATEMEEVLAETRVEPVQVTNQEPEEPVLSQEINEPVEVVNEWEKSEFNDSSDMNIENSVESESNMDNSNNIDNTITDEDFWKL